MSPEVTLSNQVTAQGEQIKALQEWRTSQGEHLVRIESKVDRLLWWIMGTLAAAVLAFVAVVTQPAPRPDGRIAAAPAPASASETVGAAKALPAVGFSRNAPLKP